MPWNKATSFASIFDDLDEINTAISNTVLIYRDLVEERREMGFSDEEILEEINENWNTEEYKFGSMEEADEWFESLGI